MSLAKNFQSQLSNQIQIHAAWFPVANTLKVGSYGLIEGGVLRPIGHITEDFGVEIGETETSAAADSVSFQSEGVKTIRVVGGGKVDAYPQAADIEGELNFEFTSSNSVLFKAATLVHERMRSIQSVANKLAKKDDWRRLRFRVVSGVYRAEAPVVLLASEAGTKFGFSAKVSALKQIEAGNAKVDFSLNLSNKRSFHSAGKAGVIGLSMFRLGIAGGIRVLAAGENAEVEQDTTLEDDL